MNTLDKINAAADTRRMVERMSLDARRQRVQVSGLQFTIALMVIVAALVVFAWWLM